MTRALAFLALIVLVAGAAGAETRIKDVTSVRGVRSNQLVGYGLVIGLNGTGDSLQNAPFTNQSIQSMLDRMGVNIHGANSRTRNVAAVMVTADLPPFKGPGTRIDVSVSSLGDATSLAGGSLVMTPLSGPDKVIYAVAQGNLTVTGFQSSGKSEKVTQGVPTSGRIPNGGLVERELPGQGSNQDSIVLELRNPDYMTAIRIVDAVNDFTKHRYRVSSVKDSDLGSVMVSRPRNVSTTRFLAELGELLVEPDSAARVVIDERTGTVVMGNNVRISTVAVTHGNLNVRVTETPKVSQPLPFSKGKTKETSDTVITAEEQGGPMAMVRGTDLAVLVKGLNRMGLKPQGIIAILQAIKSAGALQAELVVQ